MITKIYDTLDVCNWDWIPGAALPIGRRLPVQQGSVATSSCLTAV